MQKLMQNKLFHLPLLLIISVVTHFFFVLEGFGEMDATKIAISVIDIINNGSEAAFANIYFSDVIPLYILYLKFFMKLLNYNYSYLPLVMNYSNAVFGTLTIIPAFLLIKNLFRNSTVAFCSVLALIFAPSFFQSNITGFPHLISFFFLLVSLNFFLSGIDHENKNTVYLLMLFSCVFLTVAFLFKADYILAVGTYFGFLFIRKTKEKENIISAFLIIMISGVLFLFLRHIILGSTGGTTMSSDGMSKWFDFFFTGTGTLSSPALFKLQITPIIYGAGIVTFCSGVISFIYYLFKRKLDIIIFIISWVAAPTFLWFIIGGNNARHNMLSVLPLLVIIVICLYKLSPRFVIVLTVMLILGNFLVTSPSSSITRPSGNLLESHKMLENRMIEFHSRAEEIFNIDDDKIAVLGYFHNPHVIFELMRSVPSYEAVKIGREDYKIKTGNKEYVFLYIDRNLSYDDIMDIVINTYNLNNHLFVSATYDLTPLSQRGLKTKTLSLIKAGL
jgi:hypothetical protein